jgi:hypothetical protein
MTKDGHGGTSATVDERKARRRYLAFLIGLLFVAAAIRIAIALCDESMLVTRVLSDDSFYYLQIARNAATGAGVTFDGVEPANGFHPLWFVLLLPVYTLSGDGLTSSLHAALVLEAMLDVAAGLFIYLLVASLTKNRLAGIVGAAAYLLNPSVIMHSVNGLETGLNLFCFCLFFWFYLRMVDGERFSAKNAIVLGLLAGMCMLTRTDNFIIAGVTYFHLVIMKRMYRKPATVAASLVVAVLVVAPWLVWNYVTFGTFMQSSASAYGIITRGNLKATGATDLNILMHSLSNTIKLFVWTIPTDVFGWGKLLGIIAGLAVGMTLADESRTKQAWTAARLACIPLLAFLALALTHSLVRGTIKSWYFMPAAAVGAIFLGIFCSPFDCATFLSSARARIVSAFLAVVILSGFALNGWSGWTKGMLAWQSENLMAAQWLHEHVEDDVWIGSFNAGIIGYMSERRVVNLDGLANNAVVPYLKERRLWEYIEKRDIAYLVDFDYSILRDYRDFYGPGWSTGDHLLKVATIDDPRVTWAGSNIGVYRVIR